jgi:hypothetical protein
MIDYIMEQRETDISDFCQFLEQSISVSEDLLDRVISIDAVELEVEKGVKAVDKVHVPSRNTPLCQANERSFTGFGEDTSISKSSARLEALKILRGQLGNARINITGFKNNRQFLRQIWHRRYMASESRLNIGDSVDTEVSDIITDLPHISNLSSTPRRVTRSLGAVDDLPNVQSGTLEYKLRKK